MQVLGVTTTQPALQTALWTVAANCPQTQRPQPPNRLFSITTILEQRKARRTATSLPESRFWTGWMCQRYPSSPEREQWCFLRATVEPCGLDKQSQISWSVSLFLTIKRILLHHVSHITPGNPLYLCFSCLPLYLILDTRFILLCANIVDQLKDCLLYHKVIYSFDCMRIICLKSTGKTHKHHLAWKITKYSHQYVNPKKFLDP